MANDEGWGSSGLFLVGLGAVEVEGIPVGGLSTVRWRYDMAAVVVALDGPAGAGKSTVAMAVAVGLGLTYVETGAIYRTVALAARRAGVGLDDGAGLGLVARGVAIRFEFVNGVNRVFLNNEDITLSIRDPEISMAASKVSSFPEVRAELLDLQRELGCRGVGAVLEGRDIGTVVFPEARFKFFVTASVEERARRRKVQLEASGKAVDWGELVEQIRTRDHDDSTRATAPLVPASDAIVLDTTLMTIDEVVSFIVNHVKENIQ